MIPATVLMVEDREDILVVQRELLEQAGYIVHEARSADGAMDVLAKTRADILFSDIQLGAGDNNGIVLARRAHALYPDLKIVLTTGYSPYAPDDEWRVLIKPYYTETLIHEFDRVMQADSDAR